MHFHAPFFDSIHVRLKNVGGPDKGTIQIIPKCQIIFFCFIIYDFNSFGRQNSSLSELDDDVCRFLGDLSDPFDDLLFLSAQ